MMTRTLLSAAVFLLSLCLLLDSTSSASFNSFKTKKWRIDCTRYVFAPKCRGVAAKRSDRSTLPDDDTLPQEAPVRDTYSKAFFAVGDTPSELERSERMLNLIDVISRAIHRREFVEPASPSVSSEERELIERLLSSSSSPSS